MAVKIFHLFIILFCLNIFAVKSARFTIQNNCGFDIWPATNTGSGTRILSGFYLPPKRSQTITVNPPWSGNLWARTQCSGSRGALSCKTADCTSGNVECNGKGGNPPLSLAEFTLAGANQNDFFDISLVDGFNLPVSVRATRGGCPTTTCAADINRVCPKELAVRDGDGRVLGCKSACVAFNEDRYCCRGSYGSPVTCKPTGYSNIFKNQCRQAYSYAFDDKSSTFTCPTGGDYVITFCP